jgi:hypothetical protein
VTTYAWDVDGRMISAVTKDRSGAVTQQVSYAYDDAGNGVSEAVDGQTTTCLNELNQACDQLLAWIGPVCHSRPFTLLDGSSGASSRPWASRP